MPAGRLLRELPDSETRKAQRSRLSLLLDNWLRECKLMRVEDVMQMVLDFSEPRIICEWQFGEGLVYCLPHGIEFSYLRKMEQCSSDRLIAKCSVISTEDGTKRPSRMIISRHCRKTESDRLMMRTELKLLKHFENAPWFSAERMIIEDSLMVLFVGFKHTLADVMEHSRKAQRKGLHTQYSEKHISFWITQVICAIDCVHRAGVSLSGEPLEPSSIFMEPKQCRIKLQFPGVPCEKDECFDLCRFASAFDSPEFYRGRRYDWSYLQSQMDLKPGVERDEWWRKSDVWAIGMLALRLHYVRPLFALFPPDPHHRTGLNNVMFLLRAQPDDDLSEMSKGLTIPVITEGPIYRTVLPEWSEQERRDLWDSAIEGASESLVSFLEETLVVNPQRRSDVQRLKNHSFLKEYKQTMQDGFLATKEIAPFEWSDSLYD